MNLHDRDKINQLLGDLGGRLGVDLCLDSDQQCSFLYRPEKLEIQIAQGAEGRLLFTSVVQTEASPSPELLEGLNAANLIAVRNYGLALALNPEQSNVLAFRSESLQGLDEQTFQTALERFIQSSLHLRHWIAQGADAEETGAERAHHDLDTIPAGSLTL